MQTCCRRCSAASPSFSLVHSEDKEASNNVHEHRLSLQAPKADKPGRPPGAGHLSHQVRPPRSDLLKHLWHRLLVSSPAFFSNTYVLLISSVRWLLLLALALGKLAVGLLVIVVTLLLDGSPERLGRAALQALFCIVVMRFCLFVFNRTSHRPFSPMILLSACHYLRSSIRRCSHSTCTS